MLKCKALATRLRFRTVSSVLAYRVFCKIQNLVYQYTVCNLGNSSFWCCGHKSTRPRGQVKMRFFFCIFLPWWLFNVSFFRNKQTKRDVCCRHSQNQNSEYEWNYLKRRVWRWMVRLLIKYSRIICFDWWLPLLFIFPFLLLGPLSSSLLICFISFCFVLKMTHWQTTNVNKYSNLRRQCRFSFVFSFVILFGWGGIIRTASLLRTWFNIILI